MNQAVLVTGANGFIGCALCPALAATGFAVRRAVRAGSLPESVAVGDIGPDTDWRMALAGCDAVVHLAARVHVPRAEAAGTEAAFRTVNTAGTLNLARQAAAAGVSRFVFVSSIKVNGEGRAAPYHEADAAAPQDAYARSKWAAEQGLWAIAGETGLAVVVLRPPLVYGPGVGANFQRLLGWVAHGWPLPFAQVDNRRSLLYLGNLVDAIRVCLAHPAAAGKTYLVADGEEVSTPELLRRLARALRRPVRLHPLPVSWLRLAAAVSGRGAELDRLLGSLTVDTRGIRHDLGWHPPYTLDQGLAETCRHWQTHE
ncbi:MAG: SDR family oxidoreductase [Sulfuricellaceae bacterium]|nr:SDR family oxidoreductase [Sulfuricellaceae bacterium]